MSVQTAGRGRRTGTGRNLGAQVISQYSGKGSRADLLMLLECGGGAAVGVALLRLW